MIFNLRLEQLDGEIVAVPDMDNEEVKLYRILLDRMRRMAEEKSQKTARPSVDSVSFLGMTFSGSEWKQFNTAWEAHVCDNIGARLTSVRKDPTLNFYVAWPRDFRASLTNSRVASSRADSWKPHSYLEIGRDVGLKILALGHMP